MEKVSLKLLQKNRRLTWNGRYTRDQLELMRPVNLNFIYLGMRLVMQNGEAIVILSGEKPDPSGMICVTSEDGCYLPPIKPDQLLEEPLGWIDDRPVYKEARLYCVLTGELCEAVAYDDECPGATIQVRMLEGRYNKLQHISVRNLQWTRPKQLTPMFFVIYPAGVKGSRPTCEMFDSLPAAIDSDPNNHRSDLRELDVWLGDRRKNPD